MSRLLLSVGGMSCTGCESRIATALRRLDGVHRVDADHTTGTVVVDYDAVEVSEQSIRGRLVDAGYGITDEHL